MNGFSFNVNTIGIPNVCTAPWNLQHIKDLKMTEWSVEICSPIISGNKCCADVNNWLIICLSTSWCLYTKMNFRIHVRIFSWLAEWQSAYLEGHCLKHLGVHSQIRKLRQSSHFITPDCTKTGCISYTCIFHRTRSTEYFQVLSYTRLHTHVATTRSTSVSEGWSI